MASLASARFLMRNTGAVRNTIGRTCMRGTVTQLQRNERLFHCASQPAAGFIQQVQAKHSRLYATVKKVDKKNIEDRVMKVVAAYDKVTADKLTLDSHFMNDLGLDSLDHVEVIMAIEDEFGFEIPDMDAERLMKPADIVRYVADREDVYE